MKLSIRKYNDYKSTIVTQFLENEIAGKIMAYRLDWKMHSTLKITPYRIISVVIPNEENSQFFFGW